MYQLKYQKSKENNRETGSLSSRSLRSVDLLSSWGGKLRCDLEPPREGTSLKQVAQKFGLKVPKSSTWRLPVNEPKQSRAGIKSGHETGHLEMDKSLFSLPQKQC